MRKFHENFTDKDPDPDPKRPAGRIRIRIRKDPWAGSGSEMILQVGSGSGSKINSFGSATLVCTVSPEKKNAYMLFAILIETLLALKKGMTFD